MPTTLRTPPRDLAALGPRLWEVIESVVGDPDPSDPHGIRDGARRLCIACADAPAIETIILTIAELHPRLTVSTLQRHGLIAAEPEPELELVEAP